MAGFTRNLSEPNLPAAVSPSGDASVGKAIGNAIGSFGSLAIDIFKQIDNNNRTEAGQDLQKTLYNEVQSYAGTNQGPPLLGQKSNDPEINAAQSSPVVQNAVNKINTLSDSHSQGRMSTASFAARTAAIVQNAKLANPRYGAYLEGIAQQTLGWSPTQEQVALESTDQKVAKDQQTHIQQTFTDAAVNNGVAYFNPDGTPDLASTAQAGQKILQTKAQLAAVSDNVALQIQQYNLAKAKNGPELTDADKTNMEYKGIIAATLPSWNSHYGAMLSQVPQAIERLKQQGLKGEALQTAIQSELNQAKLKSELEFNNNLNGLKNPPSADAVAKARGYYDSQWKSVENYFGGNLDDASVKTRAAQLLKNNNNIDYHKSAPVLTGLNDVFGPSAIGPIVNQAIAVGTPGYNTAQAEAASITSNQAPPLEAHDHIRNATHVASGQTTLADYPPDQRRGALSTMLAGYDQYTKDPNTLNDKQLGAYGNMATNIVAQGLQGNSTDVVAAAAHTNTPSALRTFDRFASSSQDGTKADALAKGIISLNAQSLVTQYKNLKPQTVNRGAQGALADPNAKIGPYSFSSSQFSPVYNPQTGQIEIETNRTGGRTDYAPVPVDMQRAVASMNASLGAIVHLKDHSDDFSKSANDRQLKQAYIQQIGIPLKKGIAPVQMPGEKKPEQQAQNTVPDIHKVQNKIESNNNPNAVSSKGAKGVNQVMDATNLDPGYGVQPAKDNSPAERERVGRDYIDALAKHYNGNMAYALIAYNWGPGNADKWIANGGNYSQLPSETQDYLSRALLEGRKQQAALAQDGMNG